MWKISILIKNNIKLLFRKKAFILLLIALPVLSLFILNIKEKELIKNEGISEKLINELESADAQAVYLADSLTYSIKVYDSSDSILTDYILNQLINTGMFEVFRYKSNEMTDDEVLKKAEDNVKKDSIGSILYFSSNFVADILSGSLIDSVTIYRSSDDERNGLFETSLYQNINILLKHSIAVQGDLDMLINRISDETAKIPTKESKQINNSDEITLTYEQKKHENRIGYSFAIMTLAFLFGGIFIVYTIIDERDNRINIRFTLSNTNIKQYIISKLAVSVLTSFAQSVIMGIGLLIIKPEFGISIVNYLFLLILLGIIFNTLSLCLGAVLGNTMSANYAAFTIWALSGMLSGVYFSIDFSSGLLKKISFLLPQKWFIEGARMIMVGDNNAYVMMLLVTSAYLIFIVSIGAAGLKIKGEV